MTSYARDAHTGEGGSAIGPGRRAPVVVGVDAAGSALDALDWAAAEAASSDRPLRLVHAWTYPAAMTPYGFVGSVDSSYCRVAAEDILAEAVRRVRSVAVDVQVTTQSVLGTADEVLREQATVAHLLVLGSRGRRRLGALLTGSVGARSVLRCRCPVTIVRAFAPVLPGPSAARVVVGVDVAAPSGPALRYAFKAAAQRGVGVTAVCASPAASPDSPRHPGGAGRRSRLEHILMEFSRTFPGVAAVAKVVPDRPAQALIGESAGAALTVVGCRGRGQLRRALGDSVSQRVLRCAHSPVAVLGPRC